MSWLNRLFAIVPGFGNPFVNDTLYQSVGNALTTGTNTITLSTFAPTLSKGWGRIKIYGAGASSTVTLLQATVYDGTSYTTVYYNYPGTALTLNSVIAGTSLTTVGAMSSSSATLTAANNPFTPSMVGVPISVPNAGNAAGSLPLQTTVSAFVSSGNVTLAAVCAATAGVSSKTVTETGYYFNGGSATAPGGFDVIFPFEVDENTTSMVFSIGLTTGPALADVEISGTI